MRTRKSTIGYPISGEPDNRFGANSNVGDMNAESIQAMQANANMADLDIEEVDAGGRYEVKGVIFDLGDSDRMTFTDELSGKSGYVTADRYGWS